ncbi:4-hydroxy-tetrahydrodipicolinate synthase [Ilyobacter polytropus]|uniref:4-hydroxy-tetrahydrodipicolinate synthase n=1 Tax=Ilyobacter polytropus (strain ATCC 51220 / DSM 2926 / LMG 16218 / CuHBu1) TaxID=572544 RepID=E3HCM8_ILYPC|nr:4-hydroxy-tetrahydrodipicolinate synthase [Ilyobacter polytropus]ADO84423.1 dihydrodipicolinate synthase [Ilyobacter polytropus DSM 2926]
MFTGSGVAIITPFKKTGEVNFEKLAELIEFHIENKTDSIIITGTTGEASTLSDDEHLAVIKCAVDTVNGRIPVIAGTGSNDTRHGIELSVESEKLSVDGLLQVTPYYNKTNKEGLIKHFEKIAESVNIPIILYNVPGRTGMNIPVDVVEHLSKNDKIVGIKEASGNISYAVEVARLCNDNFAMYSGNDDIIVPILSIGGKGVISVVANILPKETHDMVDLFLNGEVEKSRELQLYLKPFIDSLFIETNPIPIKKAMNLTGHEVGGLRLPLYEMSEDATAKLTKEMEKINLLKG